MEGKPRRVQATERKPCLCCHTLTVSASWRKIQQNSDDGSAPQRISVALQPEKHVPTQICDQESASLIKEGKRFTRFLAAASKTSLLRFKHPPEKCRVSPYLRQTALKTEAKRARRIFLSLLFRKVWQEINQGPYCRPQICLLTLLSKIRLESGLALVVFGVILYIWTKLASIWWRLKWFLPLVQTQLVWLVSREQLQIRQL